MSRYVRTTTVNIPFDGDDVAVTIKPMTFVDCGRAMTIGEKPTAEVVSAIVADLLPRYVVSIAGLRDAAGADVDVHTVATEMYFSRLAGLILGHCVKISVLRDPTPPGEPSAPSSPG